jgi:hypothetical protein
MTHPGYAWNRYWVPREGTFSLADAGYLVIPGDREHLIHKTDATHFDSLQHFPCLVLLGEPGIGKSFEIRREFKKVSEAAQSTGDIAHYVNLRSFGSEDRLVREVFESEAIASWISSSNYLNLFFDSLDEALLRVEVLGSLIPERLQSLPIERLRLRLACRTADWPAIMESGLRSLYKSETVGVFELLPLSRSDVQAAATASELNANAFAQAVEQREVTPLAIKPVTLNFLIGNYKATGTLPSTRTRLYEEGCRRLCEETNESRLSSRRGGHYSMDERLEVASRIAALMVFGNRYAVWIGAESEDVAAEDIALSEILGGSERTARASVNVTREVVAETLDTGLFSSRGLNRLGWAHQSYAEFLAARYLYGHDMVSDQILSLIVNPFDPEARLIPQLHEVSAWLATNRKDVFDAILPLDPEVLLRSDIATGEPGHRMALVKSLLKLYSSGRLLSLDFSQHRLFSKLKYDGIADDLRPVILDSGYNPDARSLAIDIADAVQAVELEDELAEIALSPTEQLPVRRRAAIGVAAFGTPPARLTLAPLLAADTDEDPLEDLKAHALEALWPDWLLPSELFDLLTPPRTPNYIGAYLMFMSTNVTPALDAESLPVALDWVVRYQRRASHAVEHLANMIMVQGWELFDSEPVAHHFAKAALRRIQSFVEIIGDEHKSKFEEELKLNIANRHHLVALIVKQADLPTLRFLLVSRPRLLHDTDLRWVLERLAAAGSAKEQALWAELARSIPWTTADDISAVLDAAQSNSTLRNTISGWIDPVVIDSEQGRLMKALHLTRTELEEAIADRPPKATDGQVSERIRTLLEKAEGGNLDAWWRLTLELRIDSLGEDHSQEHNANLQETPGWRAADDATRARIVSCAKSYIQLRDAAPNEWIGQRRTWRPDAAGYKALRLLLDVDRNYLEALNRSVWIKWTPIVLGFETWNEKEREASRKLGCLAYRNDPDAVISALRHLLQIEFQENQRIDVMERLRQCWDRPLSQALIVETPQGDVTANALESILAFLFRHDIAVAEEFARSFLMSKLPRTGVARDQAEIAARRLLISTTGQGWDNTWRFVRARPTFAREVVSLLASDYSLGEAHFPAGLSDEQLADLFVWIENHWPTPPDTADSLAVHGPHGSISSLRDLLLRALQDRGTYSACSAIESIMRALPQLSWLKWTLHTARSNARRATWMPVTPEVLLRLAADLDRRLVQNGSDLLKVVAMSLDRLEQRFQGETPIAFVLWNEAPQQRGRPSNIRPKAENHLSDYIKYHLETDLRDRGVVLNREVQIRRGEGKSQGENTDIHIDAIIQDDSESSRDVICAIVEVKGCWHRELSSAMQTQLVDRYLMDNDRCQHGLYLVVWFACEQWDPADSRRNRMPDWSLNSARSKLAAQAVRLSIDGREVRSYVVNAALR